MTPAPRRPFPTQKQRATQAMLETKKIVIGDPKRAYHG
jgi:hypothetical protein